MPGCNADADGCEHFDNVARVGLAGSPYPAADMPAEFTAAAMTISVGAGCDGAGGSAVAAVALADWAAPYLMARRCDRNAPNR